MRSALAANIAPEYSNVMEVLVQSYRIELVLAQVLDKDWKNTSMMLASPAEDGIYKGFMGVNGWENWWLREANNVIWGNLGEEGKTFYAYIGRQSLELLVPESVRMLLHYRKHG